MRASRLGGVIHDIYMMRRGEATFVPTDNVRAIQREKLLHTVNVLLTLIEDIDDLEFAELTSNPRIEEFPHEEQSGTVVKP